MIIDVHAHYFPEAYTAFVRPPAPSQRPGKIALERLEERLRMMDEAGVERQILSNILAPYYEDEVRAAKGARLANDLYAELCRRYPDRFSFWASVPLPHVNAAIEETRRAMDDLGAVGVTIQCFCMNETIAKPAFEPLYEELDRRKAVVFLHPCQNGLCSPLLNDFGLTTCAGASMEDAVAAMHLIVAGVPARFPGIKFIVPHFGGILPMLLDRLDGQLPHRDLPEKPSATARRFYYDTVGWGSRAALLAAATAFGASQLLPGSDWPILLSWESYRTTFDHIRESGLPSEDIEMILQENVQRLLGDRLREGAIA